MKSENLIKRIISFSLVMIIAVFSAITAFAVDLDGDGYDDETGEYIGVADVSEPVYTDPVYTDPVYTEAPTKYVPETEAPIEETTIYEEDETEPQEIQTEAPTQAQIAEEQEEEETVFTAPTLAKTVSKKKYTTNYTAGLLSWICVVIGVIMVAVVIISTKVSGGKAKRKRI